MAKETSVQNIIITGKVVENNIKVGPSKTSGKVFATGGLVIETTAGNQVTVSVLQSEFKKDGTSNKIFKTLATLADEVKGLKSVAKYGADEADVVSVTGAQFVDSSFYADDGTLISYARIRASFINRLKEEEKKNYNPVSRFDAEVIINSTIEELDKEENETGRLIVNGYIIAFNGEAIPVRFIAGNVADGATDADKAKAAKAVKYISANHEKGCTVKYSGIISSKSETRVVEEEVEFGDPIINEFTRSRTEYQILSGTTAYDEEKAFTDETLKNGLAMREENLARAKERANSSGSAGDAFGSSVDNSSTGDDGLPQF